MLEPLEQDCTVDENQQLVVLKHEIARHLADNNQIRRLFHGRGGCFSGLKDIVIDLYPPVVIIYLYAQRSDCWIESVVKLLLQLSDTIAGIVVQRRDSVNVSNQVIWGTVPDCHEAEEGGLSYQLRFDRSQNIGFFPDMAIGRQLVRQRSYGKRVLNLFAYTCSFSVAALAGGAQHVVNLDMNRGALAIGKHNHQINQLDLRSTSFLAMECFKSQSKLRKLGPYDLVICDPPANQGKSFNAQQHWPKLLKRVVEVVKPQGELLLCMNGPVRPAESLDALIEEHLPNAEFVTKFSPNDHHNNFPDGDCFGETAIRLIQL
ncbi:MAG: SAM-dependent methyltransferase [Desulfobacteraceae bacterium 4572_35.2]|nr:MAG: SAM-dependent methyltransferase [Desulfobacteraceae bacterium 4572_35.2]